MQARHYNGRYLGIYRAYLYVYACMYVCTYKSVVKWGFFYKMVKKRAFYGVFRQEGSRSRKMGDFLQGCFRSCILRHF